MDSKFNDLTKLKNIIERMDVIHHKKILVLFKKRGINISENRNGSFINITNINDNIIEELNDYKKYLP